MTLARHVLAASVALSTAVHAADTEQATDQFLALVAHGCVKSVVDAQPVQTFVRDMNMPRAPDTLTRALLGKDAGAVFLKDDPQTPMALTARIDGPCTVNARFPGDLAETINTVDDWIAGPGGRFFVTRVFEEEAGNGTWTTHRMYVGKYPGKHITALFSTNPDVADLGQVTLTIAAEARK